MAYFNQNDAFGYLCAEKIDFLSGLPAEKLESLMACAVWKHCEKGDALFREGDRVDAIFILHSGKVKLTTFDSDGREQIVGIFAEYDTIWEGVFMEGSRFPYSAICVTEVDCCRILRRDFEETIRDPVIAMKVIGLLSRKLHDANERNLLLSTAAPKARLAGFLLYRSQRSVEDTITLRLDDIAASISLRPETVSRKIRELEREGFLKREGQSGIRILDQDGLSKLFEG